MKTDKIRLVIILGILSILGIIAVQVFWLKKSYEVKEQQYNETIHKALLNVVEKMSPESISNEDIINQLSPDYFVVNVNDVIDANVLDYYLTNEFSKLQLFLDFEYAIYDCSSDKMMYGTYVNVSDHSLEVPTTELQTYDEYIYYFGVKFPTKSSYVISNMRTSIFFALVLFFAIAFFGYTLYIILLQKRRSELQTDFINNMTHEFKTPIASITLAADVLLKSKEITENKRLENFSKIIKEQGERLNLQVEKVLQLAKDQDNILELKLETFNLNKVLESVTRSSLPNFEKAGGTIHYFENSTDILIKADKLHLTNILHNILDNSLKYCEKAPEVQIDLMKTNKLLEIKIKDNGIGIDKKFQSQIFDKFFRVPTGNVHNVKGFGLGLFYVKKVIDQHAWKLKINSEEGKGTEILIILKT